MESLETTFNCIGCVNDHPNDVESSNKHTLFPKIGKSIGSPDHFKLTDVEKLEAYRHVLMNCIHVDRFVQ